MKKLLFVFMLLAAFTAHSQQSAQTAVRPAKESVMLVCKLLNVPLNIDSINLYEHHGLANRVVARAGRRQPDSAFVFSVPVSNPRFYGVGVFGDNSLAKVILGQEKEVTLWGNTNYLDKARTMNSPANKGLENVLRQIGQFRTESETLRSRYYNTLQATDRRPVEESAVQLNRAKNRFLDSLKTANAMLWRLASLHVTPEYLADKAAAPAELEFYGSHYFRNASLADKTYDETPDVFNAFELFVQQLTQIGASGDNLKTYIDMQLGKLPAGTKTYRMALGGIVSGLKIINSPVYPVYAGKYLDLYRNNSLGEIARLDLEMKKSATFMAGFEAPDLEGMTPDSNTYSLKKMRGKVVMIDFWASWCGPCRKENPNVVANYKKYKDKGFDILGVSLDTDANKWRKAIEQDGLGWRHISDLKGWQSKHAALYSVSSIPQTLLLDREGKIIARNLRGEQLGQKLKEIFGE